MIYRTAVLVLVVLAVAWLQPEWFPPFAFLAGLAWVVLQVTTARREEATPGEEGLSQIRRAAQFMGYGRGGTNLRAFRVGWREMPMAVRGAWLGSRPRRLEGIDLATPFGRFVPLVFVIRSSNGMARDSWLVENTRVPRARFEYQLRTMELDPALEIACNLPDLMTDLLDQGLLQTLRQLLAGNAPVQQVFFNGHSLHTQLVLLPEANALDLSAVANYHVRFHLTLTGLLDNVAFKAPL